MEAQVSTRAVGQTKPRPINGSDELVRQSEKYLSSIQSAIKSVEAAGTITSVDVDSEAATSALTENRSDRSTRLDSMPPLQVIDPSFDEKVVPDTSPLQIWEGRVLYVDHARKLMGVMLTGKLNPVPEHTGEIDLEWVSEQDAELVKPGAVFYLTLFKRWKRTTVENSQELRFRRMPYWTKRQLLQVEEDARMLRSKFKVAPTAA